MNKENTDTLLVLLLVFAISFFAYLMPIWEADTWWLIAGGREVLGGHLPTTNTFSWVYADHPWNFTQWLFGTILALLTDTFGVESVSLLPVIVGIGILFVLVQTTRLRGEKLYWVLLTALLVLFASQTRFRMTPRGHIITIFCVVFLQYLWLKRPKHLLLMLFALGALWANMHAGVVFGAIYMGFVVVDAAIVNREKNFKLALQAAGLFFLGSLVNVNFTYVYTYIFSHGDFLNNFPLPIRELKAPGWSRFELFWIFLPLCALAVVRELIKRKNFLLALTFLFYASLAVRMVRFIPFLWLFLFPICIFSLLSYQKRSRRGLVGRGKLQFLLQYFCF